jgi:hypothetical protein
VAAPESSTSPAFLGIGAPRSGTTWLHRNLRQHPEIWLTPVKEIHYFDKRGGSRRSNRYYRAHLRKRLRQYVNREAWLPRALPSRVAWDLHFFLGRRTNRWYERLFHPGPGQIAGEITPAYSMLDMEVVEEVRNLNPDLRVVYLLRDPIERCWSGAVSELVRRTGQPLDAVPDEAFIRHFDGQGHVLRGNYLRTLTTWEGVFGREQVFVGFLDEIEQAPRDVLLRLYRFLGVSDDEALVPDSAGEKANVAGDHRSPVPERFQPHLARQYLPQLEVLSERFGEPVTSWLRRAQAALASSTANSPA